MNSKWHFAAMLLLGCAIALAQINLTNIPIIPAVAETNLTAKMVALQLSTVRDALPVYFVFEDDPVDKYRRVTLKNPVILEDDGTGRTKLDLVFYLEDQERLPDKIYLHIVSVTDDWRYLEYHDFTIRFDEQKLTRNELFYQHDVIRGGVIEQFDAGFSLEEFRRLAWAREVWFKLGGRNFYVSYAERQKWKLLWKYFDLRRTERELELKTAIGEKRP